jgi:UDP-N-acetylmuramate dehydrogenase
VVIRVLSGGITETDHGATVELRVAAGVEWDALVQCTIAGGLAGLETMSGIPGLVGATPVQNVGAYGAEVADVLTGLTVYDRERGVIEPWLPSRCEFGFRTSAFKHTDRYVVLDVTMRLARSAASRPIRYLELARRLRIEPGQSAPLADVRSAVLALRRSKGMVLDAADHDSWSVGSFFVNPLLESVPDAARDCPQWQADGRIKLSAAWLIEQAGFPRGYGLDRGRGAVSVSTKHTLSLTNRGGATTAELLDLAAEIRAGVQTGFGITLGPEAHLRNCSF